MQITFKLYASLGDYLPVDRRVGNAITAEVADGSTVQQVIDAHNLPHKLVHLVLVNGHYIAPADRATRALVAGDTLALWPPIAGG
jgi:sulfur carrier protein ThiS